MSNFYLTLEFKNNTLLFTLNGRITSENTPDFGKSIDTLRSEYPGDYPVIFDCKALKYISSAGLRVLLSLSKKVKFPLKLINVSKEISDIFDMTGFSKIFEISRTIEKMNSIQGELIGIMNRIEFYRLKNDFLLKLYPPETELEEAEREIKYAKAAFMCGVPALIPYNAVMVYDRYGVIYEFPNAINFSLQPSHDDNNSGKLAAEMGKLLKVIHSCIPEEDDALPETRYIFEGYIEKMSEFYSKDETGKLTELLHVIPEGKTIVYGSFQPADVFMQNDEAIVINTRRISTGNPIFDLGITYMLMIIDGKRFSKHITGLEPEQAKKIWDTMIRAYLGTEDEKVIALHEKKILACSLLCAALFPAMIQMPNEDAKISVEYARRSLFPSYEKVKKLLSGVIN